MFCCFSARFLFLGKVFSSFPFASYTNKFSSTVYGHPLKRTALSLEFARESLKRGWKEKRMLEREILLHVPFTFCRLFSAFCCCFFLYGDRKMKSYIFVKNMLSIVRHYTLEKGYTYKHTHIVHHPHTRYYTYIKKSISSLLPSSPRPHAKTPKQSNAMLAEGVRNCKVNVDGKPATVNPATNKKLTSLW